MKKKPTVPNVIISTNPKPISEKPPSYQRKIPKPQPLTNEQKAAVIKEVRRLISEEPAFRPPTEHIIVLPPAEVKLTPDAPRSGNNWYDVVGGDYPEYAGSGKWHFDTSASNYAGIRVSEIWPNGRLWFVFETIPGKTYLVDLDVFGHVLHWKFSGAVEATVPPPDYPEHILLAFIANDTMIQLIARVEEEPTAAWSPSGITSCVLTRID